MAQPLEESGRRDELDPLPPVWGELFDGLQAALVRSEAERERLGSALERTATELREQLVELEALRRARSAAESANLVRGQILALVSRTMRAPADALLGITSLLRLGALIPTQRAYVEALQAAAEALRGTLNEVSDFSRLESGTLALEPIRFDLRVMVEDLAATLGAEAEAKGSSLRVAWQARTSRRVSGDPGRIRQVLTALIRDGLSRVQRGEVQLELGPVPGGDGIQAVVEDSGPSIPPDLLPTVFEPFERSELAAEREQGCGLALPIARHLVQLMGGELLVENRPDAGTRFTARLPLMRLAPGAAGPSAPVPAAVRPSGSGSRLPGTLLVVEADPDQRAGWISLAEAAGYEAEGFPQRGDALTELMRRARAGRPVEVVLFSDHDAEGYEAIGRGIVDHEPLGKPALIMLPAAGNPGDARRLGDAGFRGYLVKPVAPDDLREALETLRRTPRSAWHTIFLTRHSLAEARRGPELPDDEVEASLQQLMEQ